MNSIKINLRKLNILDFDGKEFTIRLNNDYLNHIKQLITNYGSYYQLGTALNIDYTKIWQAMKLNNIPLYMLRSICKYFNLDNVKNNIEAYKYYGGRKWIGNPVLEIKESPELAEIAGHLLGDGFLTITKEAQSSYTNTSKELIGKFNNFCQKVFGNVDFTIYFDKRFNAESVMIPKQISSILSAFYPEILNKKVPQHIFELPQEYISSFIRAFADDESCVTTSAIYYVQKDKVVLEDIRKLHLLVGFKDENLTSVKKNGNVYNFSIKGGGLVYFYENIGYKHPSKMRDLEIEVKRKNNKRTIKTIDTTKKEITHFLSTPKTIKELSALIGIQPTRIRKHIKKLEYDSYVKIVGYKKYKVPLWVKMKNYQLIDDRRKNKLIEFLNNSKLSTLDLSKKIELSKDRLLTYLYELKNEGKINYEVKGRAYIWYLE